MRKKCPMLVISFQTTTQALAVDKACKKRGIPGRMIPLPQEISAGCGLAWSISPKEKSKIICMMKEENLSYDTCTEILF